MTVVSECHIKTIVLTLTEKKDFVSWEHMFLAGAVTYSHPLP